MPWFGGAVHCTVWFGWVDGRKCFFIEPHSEERFFARGHLYGADDDVARFALFSRAALEFMLKSGKRPEVIHCHDWETALVPVLLFETYQSLGMERSAGLPHGSQLSPSGRHVGVGAVGGRAG